MSSSASRSMPGCGACSPTSYRSRSSTPTSGSAEFAGRAAIGFAIPLLAAAWPVFRGLRGRPIEAIRVGFRSSRGGGLAPLLARVPLPGGSLGQMPPRNVVRAPRRTLLTVLASAAVISVAVSMSGMLDSFEATVDRNAAEETRMAPDRLEITLAGFVPADTPGAAPARLLADRRRDRLAADDPGFASRPRRRGDRRRRRHDPSRSAALGSPRGERDAAAGTRRGVDRGERRRGPRRRARQPPHAGSPEADRTRPFHARPRPR